MAADGIGTLAVQRADAAAQFAARREVGGVDTTVSRSALVEKSRLRLGNRLWDSSSRSWLRIRNGDH